MVKDTIYTEHDLSVLTMRKYKTSLAKFRCSAHSLFIETGRYQGINKEDRICQMCNLNCIEDEFHFLCLSSIFTFT